MLASASKVAISHRPWMEGQITTCAGLLIPRPPTVLPTSLDVAVQFAERLLVFYRLRNMLELLRAIKALSQG